jgi:predicted O-methyltransferase YrrM
VIVCDNLLWKGKVASGDHDAATDALRAFNKRIATDERLITSVLAVGDGTGVSVVI